MIPVNGNCTGSSKSTRVDTYAGWLEEKIEYYAPWDDEPQVQDVVRRRNPTTQLFYYEPAVDIDNDGRSDFCYRQASGFDCVAYDSSFNPWPIAGPTLSDVNGFGAYSYYSTIRLADMDGDGDTDVCFRDSSGFFCRKSNGVARTFQPNATGAVPLSNANGFNKHRYYSTIRMADINCDLKDDVCVRQATGFDCFLSTGTGFSSSAIAGPTAWSDANGFDRHEHYATIRMGDINGDGKADACAREDSGIRCYISTGTGFGSATAATIGSDAGGYDKPRYYSTFQLADVTGDNRDDACIRSSVGYTYVPATGTGFNGAGAFTKLDLNDAAGFSAHKYYSTIRLAQITGADRRADLCVRTASAVSCYLSSGTAFGSGVTGPAWSDAASFGLHQYYSTMQFGDVDGDGRSDANIRDSIRIVVQLASTSDSGNFPIARNGPSLSGFSLEKYYRTIRIGAVR